MIRRSLLSLVQGVMASRPPDFIVGEPKDPYLLRWFVFPRNKWGNIYLHKFLRDDNDEALHDHPYHNCSLILSEGYDEVMLDGTHARRPGKLVFRRAPTPHRVVLHRDPNGFLIPAISLFLCGPRVRVWGFLCPKGWVPFDQFVDLTKGYSNRGKGCPE